MTQSKGFALITGAAGGIGQALVKAFDNDGYSVIATDIVSAPDGLSSTYFLQADLQQTVEDEAYAETIFAEIRRQLNGNHLRVLINNAATQILGRVENLTRNDWRATLDINLMAPFFWTQAFLPELEATRGSVINISSIHARLTKLEFAAYATSKAALSGLTRSLALELGDRVRVNAIELAAIDTGMLQAGFRDKPNGFAQLERYHPTKSIGLPEEVGKLAVMLVGADVPFMNGSIISLDGGIGGCLYDPS